MPENIYSKENKQRQFDEEQYQMLIGFSKKNEVNLEWNKWREENPDIPVLLEGANLANAHLVRINLEGANLCGANLYKVDIRDSNLVGVNLEKANLNGSKLQGAELNGANLEEAKFVKAKLMNTKLNNANLKNAKLLSVDLEYAELDYADLTSAELIGSKMIYIRLNGANLKGANLNNADLEGAELIEANFENAESRSVNLKGANLSKANFKGADFSGCNIEEAIINEANLTDAIFKAAIVNGKTLIWDCIESDKTNFKGVGLDSARVSPILKERLKGNIRKIQWEGYYKRKPASRWPVHFFWKVSDYGRSTTQIIKCFFILSLLFAFIYYISGFIDDQGIVTNLFYYHDVQNQSSAPIEPWVVPFRAVYFSVVTMTTLGFGDMYANSRSILGHILLTIQVMLGYGLLGALVTRFGVLFTSSGPGQD